jgi:hypothetical protein
MTTKKRKKKTKKTNQGLPGAFSVVAAKALDDIPATVQAHQAWWTGRTDPRNDLPAPPALWRPGGAQPLSTLPGGGMLPYGLVVDLSKLKPKTKFLAFFFTEFKP